MKVYVDELPKECWDCPCFRNDTDFSCGLGDGVKDYYLDEIDGGECPLKSITEHDKELKRDISYKVLKFLKGNGFDLSEWEDLQQIIEED